MAKDNIVLRWNTLLLQAVKNVKMRPPVVARAIAMLNTGMYDAWAYYDAKAKPVHVKNFQRRPPQYWHDSNRAKAMSYAAYEILCDLFPTDPNSSKGQVTMFLALMQEYAYKTPADTSHDTDAAVGITAADDNLAFYHDDESNQKNGYEDTSERYQPTNTDKELCDINHWQPLSIKQSDGSFKSQVFLYPHWGQVNWFAVNPQSVKPILPSKYPRKLPVPKIELKEEEQDDAELFETNCKEVIVFSSNLNDEAKIIAEYWEGGAGTVTPPGIWSEMARLVSLRDCHDLNKDIKLFFALGNALHDSAIACWFTKVKYDFCRPISAIHTLLSGTSFDAWAGQYKGIKKIEAEKWQPYLSPTPPFSEYVSGHSTFSSAGAEVLKLFTGSDFFGHSVKIVAGASRYEPGMVPAQDIKLEWRRFSQAAEQAGLSRCYGGIHFWQGNTHGLAMGKKIAAIVWNKVQKYCDGTINNSTDSDETC